MAASEKAGRPRPDAAAFRGRKGFCDVIMKGGITSGVVYPPAIAELATRYRFKNIGGASAGAIAAATAAAAEYARQDGGFGRLLDVADDVSGILLSLFQPARPFRPLFRILLVLLGEGSKTRKFLRALAALGRGYAGTTLLGAVPGLLLACHAWGSRGGWEAWFAAAVVLVIGVLLACLLRLWRVLARDLPAHRFGICSGLREPDQRGLALTEWLSDRLDEIAGLKRPGEEAGQGPLTFGHLMGADPSAPDINLAIMTTNLTAGRPHRMPFEAQVYMYRESEFAALFPPRVATWLREHSNPVSEGDRDLRWLPHRKDLPVVVAVRMSLSFPVLLAAVPLHARDYTLLDRKAREEPRPCWFSDGGICSNFPIHLFDSVWPRWPTFGITLGKHDKGRHADKVWLPQGARQGILQEFRAIDSLTAFLEAIVRTMQEWRDGLQTVLPGYRERIARVTLDEDEGGLHLNMPPDLIHGLMDLGRQAGEKLRDAFDFDAHRWRRYLVAMGKLEETLQRMQVSNLDVSSDWEPQHGFLDRYAEYPAEYDQTREWLRIAAADTADILTCAARWLARPPLRGETLPRPEPDFRITPRV